MERRLTQFPGSTQQRKRSQSEDGGEDRRLSTSKLPKPPKVQHRDYPRLRIPINPEALQWKKSRHSGPFPAIPTRRDKFFHRGPPWTKYYAMYEEDEGSTIIAHKKELTHDVVAVKKTPCPAGNGFTGLKPCAHPNIVTLHEIYADRDCLFFVYDQMDVTIAEVQATPVGNFAPYQIAAILQGLQFIHEKLKVAHGSIDANTVVVNRDGHIKLGIGAALLHGKTSTQDDCRAIGDLMMFMMGERVDPAATGLELQRPGEWDSDIKEFLKKTATSSGSELRKDDFLLKNPGASFFKILVIVTEKSISREWRLRMDG